MLSEIAVVITRAAAEAVIILIAAQSRNDDDIILPRRYGIALDRLRDPEFSGCKSVEVISKAKVHMPAGAAHRQSHPTSALDDSSY